MFNTSNVLSKPTNLCIFSSLNPSSPSIAPSFLKFPPIISWQPDKGSFEDFRDNLASSIIYSRSIPSEQKCEQSCLDGDEFALAKLGDDEKQHTLHDQAIWYLLGKRRRCWEARNLVSTTRALDNGNIHTKAQLRTTREIEAVWTRRDIGNNAVPSIVERPDWTKWWRTQYTFCGLKGLEGSLSTGCGCY